MQEIIRPDGQLVYHWGAGVSEHHDYILPAIRSLLPGPPATLLDVGCGNGHLASCYRELGYQVVGFDQSVEGVAVARRQYPEVRFEQHSVLLDYSAITAPVDIVVSSEVIEHLSTPRKLLENAYSILKPGGTFIITTPFHGYWKNLAISLIGGWDKHFDVYRDLGHIKFFSEKTLSRLLKESGFHDLRFNNAGRMPGLWKSLVVGCKK